MIIRHSLINRQEDIRKQKSLIFLFSALAIATAVMGMIPYLTGAIHNWALQSSNVPMAPGTAICMILLSTGTFLNTARQDSRKTSIPLFIVSTLVGIFVFFGIIGYLTGTDLNFEHALSPDWGTVNGIAIGLMSPATSLVLLLIAVSLFLRSLKQLFPKSNISQETGGATNAFALIVSFVFALAYMYGSPLLYDLEETIPMAFSSAIGFVFLSTAALITGANAFPLRFLVENSWKNYLLRYLMPLSVFSVLLGGFTTIIPIRFLETNPALLNALLTLIIAIFSVFISTLLAGKIEQELTSHQLKVNNIARELKVSEEQYRNLFETMAQGVVYQNSKGEIFAANPAAEKILGLTVAQMTGRTSIDPRWKAVDKDMKELPGEQHPAMLALKTRKPVENFIQGIYNPKVNDYVWILVNSVPQFKTGEDKPWQVYSTFLDITDRYTAEQELLLLKINLERQVDKQTSELKKRIEELEHFHEVTIQRELRMEELRQEIARLKDKNA